MMALQPAEPRTRASFAHFGNGIEIDGGGRERSAKGSLGAYQAITAGAPICYG